MRTLCFLACLISSSILSAQSPAERRKMRENTRAAQKLIDGVEAPRDRVGDRFALLGEVLTLDDDDQPTHDQPIAVRFVVVKTPEVDYCAVERDQIYLDDPKALAINDVIAMQGKVFRSETRPAAWEPDKGGRRVHHWQERLITPGEAAKHRWLACYEATRWANNNEVRPYVDASRLSVFVPRNELLDQLLGTLDFSSYLQTNSQGRFSLGRFLRDNRLTGYSGGTVHTLITVPRRRLPFDRKPEDWASKAIFDPAVGMMPTRFGLEKSGSLVLGHEIEWYEHHPGLFLPQVIKTVTSVVSGMRHHAAADYYRLTWFVGDEVGKIDPKQEDLRVRIFESFGRPVDLVVGDRLVYSPWRFSDEVYQGFEQWKPTAYKAREWWKTQAPFDSIPTE